jgi:LysM repeat protein
MFMTLCVTSILAAAGVAAADYVVRSGDSLGVIAARNHTTVDALVRLNNIKNPDMIDVGQILKLTGGAPPPTTSPPRPASGVSTYVVRPGDSLSGVAYRLKVRLGDIIKLNSIMKPDLIDVGQVLKIPGSAATAPVLPTTTRPAASVTPTTTRPAVTPTTSPPATPWWPASVVAQAARLKVYPDLIYYANRLAYVPLFDQWAAAYAVPADLLKAMCFHESGWRPDATSPSGALGMCQIMPYESKWLAGLIGVPTLSPLVAGDNIRMGAQYLRLLLDQTKGDASMALAGYYQGLPSVVGRGMYSDTRDYVATVTAYRAWFR